MRAREPDAEGYVDRAGVKLHYVVPGDGAPTLLLLPAWTIVQARFGKAQVLYSDPPPGWVLGNVFIGLTRTWNPLGGGGRSRRPTSRSPPLKVGTAQNHH